MIFAILLIIVASAFLFVKCAPQFGAAPSKKEKQLMLQSPNYKNGVFVNLETTPVMSEKISPFKMIREYRKGAKERGPKDSVITKAFDRNSFMDNSSKIALSWLGHSTTLLKVGKYVIITDPVFSKRASPFSFIGTKAFNYTHKYSIDSLPPIDFVVISHDHYDHLDYKAIKKIDKITKHFLVPLGVKSHLERWGVASEKITELDWWSKYEVDATTWFVNTPARHFSGRGITNRNSTLWSSWVISSNNSRVFFGGDSGYGIHFKQIGDKYGPFDLTMVECGQYNEHWAYIHSTPEQTIQENIDLKGKLLLPIHREKFILSLHNWLEPIERAKKEAEIKGVNLLNPVIGEVITINAK